MLLILYTFPNYGLPKTRVFITRIRIQQNLWIRIWKPTIFAGNYVRPVTNEFVSAEVRRLRTCPADSHLRKPNTLPTILPFSL
jgi:hypothetical protein